MDFKNEILMMSEEEARNRAKELLNENQVDLITKYMFLEQQCKKQKEVIDKAIEYINKYAWQEDIIGGIYTTTGKPVIDRYMQLEWDNCNELLDILKEVEETDTNVGEVE